VLADLELVRREALTEAEGRLARRGRLSPFAIVLNNSRATRLVETSSKRGSAPIVSPVDRALDLALATVKATRGHARTYLVFDAEHRHGPRVKTVIDYKRRGWFRQGVTFGDAHESLTERSVWLAEAE
jgi:hypothetical protein